MAESSDLTHNFKKVKIEPLSAFKRKEKVPSNFKFLLALIISNVFTLVAVMQFHETTEENINSRNTLEVTHGLVSIKAKLRPYMSIAFGEKVKATVYDQKQNLIFREVLMQKLEGSVLDEDGTSWSLLEIPPSDLQKLIHAPEFPWNAYPYIESAHRDTKYTKEKIYEFKF